jgi:hypothetical protein
MVGIITTKVICKEIGGIMSIIIKVVGIIVLLPIIMLIGTRVNGNNNKEIYLI